MWTQSCSHDILCPPAEGKEYREAAFNWISFPDPVNPALLFTQVRGTMCQSSATLMCCVPCPRFMAHFTLCHRAASQWSGPRTGVLIGQPLPISKTNNSWRYCGRHLTFSRVVFVCWIIQHVPAPVCVPHWNVHVWDVVVFRGLGRKKKKEASTDMMRMTSKSTATVHSCAVFSLPRSGLTLVCTNAEEIFCDKPWLVYKCRLPTRSAFLSLLWPFSLLPK